ncbi:hypothetical protein [Roseomonas populi]|uniref:Glycosyltransferase RgtA/B/C/D-like domain-containing protein n=1 Tax=Roseomonas populi TaxID=3121582 RepID=A0ABT1XCI1_9PROT|nr:hypothetical protein [Roseomonas pecuniae]MCR0985649.1 hypothetical protein [Roseomonas pecuniae]
MLRVPTFLRHPGAPLVVLMAVLTLRYIGLYFADPALPGNNLQYPAGWWGWWDQSQYIGSARALAQGDLSVAKHWYPMGYALLGAPFTSFWPAHPYFLVGLAALLLTAWAFLRFARRTGVGDWTATALFLGSVAVDKALAQQWAIPWNTTPTTALLWVMLWLVADHMAGQRRPVLLGALVSAVALMRPTDLLSAGIILGGLGLHEIWHRRAAAWGTIWRVALGGAVVGLAGLALHVAIYGFAKSPYMLLSTNIGFSLHAYGWKAFNLLVAPQPWWGTGQGLISRHPWIGLALVLLPFAVRRGPAVAVLAVAAVVHVAFYIAYVDLLPTGLWLFHNVHYFKWVGPAFALLAWLGLVQAAARQRGWPVPAAVSAAILLLLCVRIVPVPAGNADRWRAVQMPGPTPGFDQSYFKGDAVLRDAAGEMRNIPDMRLYPVPQGMRAFGLRRDFVPPVEALPEGARPIVSRAVLAWPCWLPGKPAACRRLGGA